MRISDWSSDVCSSDLPFLYLAIVQSPYLSAHVGPNRVDFDFSAADDADVEPDLLGENLIPRADIRNTALPFIQADLKDVIESINSAKFDRIKRYVTLEAPRSAERRVGKECVSTCRSRWSPYH